MPSTTIPATRSLAFSLPLHHTLRIINTHGTQTIALWAFSTSLDVSTASPPDYQELSMPATHGSLRKLVPCVGDTLVSNERKPMLTLVEDTSGGRHDTTVAACDRWCYEEVEGKEVHRNCADNLGEAMKAIGIPPPPFIPLSYNLFMNAPIAADPGATLSYEAPISPPGSYVTLRAEMELLVVLSACPQDKKVINAFRAMEVQFEKFAPGEEGGRDGAK